MTKSVQYQYDALGRRIGKSVDDTGDGTMDRRESFIYDGAGLLADAAGSIHIAGPNGALNQAGWTDQMILSFTDPDADGSSLSQLASRNLYGPAVDQLFATEVANGSVLWALTDHQGTPRDWATRSSSTGTTTIAQHTRYTAFGAISSIVDATGNPLAATATPLPSFTGQLYDADAALMYYRARWYDPQLGKFLNDDPMGFAAGDANVSRYVGNRVSSHRDSTGLEDPPIPNPYHEPRPPLVVNQNTSPNPGDPNWTYDPLYTPGIPFRPVGNSLPATAAILITSYGGPMIFGPLVSMNPSIIMFRPFLNTPRTPLPPRPTEPPDWWPNVTNLPYHDPALNCPHSPGLGCHENSNCGWHISNPDAGPYLQWRKDIFE